MVNGIVELHAKFITENGIEVKPVTLNFRHVTSINPDKVGTVICFVQGEHKEGLLVTEDYEFVREKFQNGF